MYPRLRQRLEHARAVRRGDARAQGPGGDDPAKQDKNRIYFGKDFQPVGEGGGTKWLPAPRLKLTRGAEGERLWAAQRQQPHRALGERVRRSNALLRIGQVKQRILLVTTILDRVGR